MHQCSDDDNNNNNTAPTLVLVTGEEVPLRRGISLPRCASTGTFPTTSNTSSKASLGRTTRRLLPPLRRGTSKEDMLSVSLPGIFPYPGSSATTVVNTLYVPLKSCMSHNQLDTLLLHGNNSNNGMKKSVSFHKIEIREHSRTLGDSPSVSNGPALAIDWESSDLGSLSLDDYERLRPPRRTKSELAVPRRVRETMLRNEAGISRWDMAAANRERERLRQQARRRHDATAHPLRAFKKLLSGAEAATQRQVDELMEQSRRVEQEREQQRQAYLAQLVQELSDKQQQQEEEQQLPGQSTREEEKRKNTQQASFSTTTTKVDERSSKAMQRLNRRPSFLPDQDHADSDDDQSTDLVLEF